MADTVCSNCGRRIDSETRFCPGCGAPVINMGPQVSPSSTTPLGGGKGYGPDNSMYPLGTPLGTSQHQRVATQPLSRRTAPKKKSKNVWVPVLFLLFFAILAGSVAFFVINNNKKSHRGAPLVFEGPETAEMVDIESPAVEEVVVEEPVEEVIVETEGLTEINAVQYVKGTLRNSKGSYPIVMYYELGYDDSFTGRYAYNLTLNKYGDVAASWITMRGFYTIDGNKIDVEAYTYLYGEEEPFEAMEMTIRDSYISGVITNMNTYEPFDLYLK